MLKQWTQQLQNDWEAHAEACNTSMVKTSLQTYADDLH